MITKIPEKVLEESRNDCKRRTSSIKEIPRWSSVASISCPKLNEVICCQRIAYSLLFYIFVALFLLVFVYILRKLVSLPSGLVKHNARKPTKNTSTAISLSNHSNNPLTKRLPIKWPKIDKIVNDLAAHSPASATVKSSKDKKSRVYHVPDGTVESYKSSGLFPSYPNPSENKPTQRHLQDFQTEPTDYGTVSQDVTTAPQEDARQNSYNSLFNSDIPKYSQTLIKQNSTDTRNAFGIGDSQWSPWNYPENSRFGKTRPSSFAMDNPENSGFLNTVNEGSALSAWNYAANSGFKSSDHEWTTWNYPAKAGFKNSHYPAWDSAYSGSHFVEGPDMRAQYSSGSGVRSRLTAPVTSGTDFDKWGTTFSSWPKLGSGWPAGSGFGWLRSSDYDSKNPYGSRSSFSPRRLDFDEVSGKWAYSGSNEYNHDYNYYPTGKTRDDTDHDYPILDETINPNHWNPHHKYTEVKQNDDWSNINALNGQNLGILKTSRDDARKDYQESFGSFAATSNRIANQQYHISHANVRKEKSDRIHRWPLQEWEEESSVDNPSSQRHSTLNSHHQLKSGRGTHKKAKHRKLIRKKVHQDLKIKKRIKPDESNREKKGQTKSRSLSHRKLKKMVSNLRKTQANSSIKKSKIPYDYAKKIRVKQRKVKSKIKSKLKVKVKGKKSPVSVKASLRTRPNNKRRKTGTTINQKRSKNSNKRFPSYASYKTFLKKHKISDILVGKWHHTLHHVRRCKKLSHFKTDGKVQLSRRYLHRKRIYRYTVLSCRYVHNENRGDDGNKDADEDSHKNQICREYWYITTARIILRKITSDHTGNSYVLTMCNKAIYTGGVKDTQGKILDEQEETLDPDDDEGDDDDKNNTDSNKETGEEINHTDDKNFDDVGSDNDDIGGDVAEATRHVTNKHKGTGVENDEDADITDTNMGTNSDTKEDLDKTETNRRTENDEDRDLDDDNDDVHRNDPGPSEGAGKVKYGYDKDYDGQDDFDNSDSVDNVSEKHDDNDNFEAIDNEIDFDDEIDNNVDRNEHTEHIHVSQSKHKTLPKRRKKNKLKPKSRKSKSNVKNFLSPELNDKILKKRYQKASKKDKYKKPFNNNVVNHSRNSFERLSDDLKTNNDSNDTNKSLAQLVAAILLEKSASRELIKNRKPQKHSWNKRRVNSRLTIKEKQASFSNTLGVTDTNNLKIFLQNVLTNSKNAQSRSQVMTRQSKHAKKMSIKATRKEGHRLNMPSRKPLSQIDEKNLTKELLSRSTSSTTATPIPTVQPAMQTTHTSNQDVVIHNLLGKLAIKSSLNANTTDVLLRLLPRKKAEDRFSAQKTSETERKTLVGSELTSSQFQQKFLFPKSSKLPLLNPSERQSETVTSQDNSVVSYTPTAKPMQRYLLTPQTNQHLPSSTSSTYGNEIKDLSPSLLGTRGANLFPYGYSMLDSTNNNPYSYQPSLINILCFGDSLTSGYFNHGLGKHPYSIRLNQLLNAGGQHRFRIITRGKVGEMVHGSMTKRLPKILNEGSRFDWVIILGGTNDVAHVKNFGDDEEFTTQLIKVWSPKIVKDIEKLHETARWYGARTVLITIPETAYELWPEFQSIRNMRLSVNSALRQYATQVKDTTVLCDLATKLPRSSLTSELRKLYWNDHIHLNPIGYDKMAEVIEQCIRPYLTK